MSYNKWPQSLVQVLAPHIQCKGHMGAKFTGQDQVGEYERKCRKRISFPPGHDVHNRGHRTKAMGNGRYTIFFRGVVKLWKSPLPYPTCDHCSSLNLINAADLMNSFFKIGFYYVPQAGLELILQPRKA